MTFAPLGMIEPFERPTKSMRPPLLIKTPLWIRSRPLTRPSMVRIVALATIKTSALDESYLEPAKEVAVSCLRRLMSVEWRTTISSYSTKFLTHDIPNVDGSFSIVVEHCRKVETCRECKYGPRVRAKIRVTRLT